MNHFETGAIGTVTALILSVTTVLMTAATVAPVLTRGLWPDLMGGVVIVCSFAGYVFPLCVSAYRDKAAEVTGYCRPLREPIP